MSEKTELLSVQEVSKTFGLSIRTVQRLSKQGKIKSVKLGRQWKYVKEDIEKYLLLGIDLSKNIRHIERRAYPRINSNFNCQYSINLPPFKEINNKGIIKNLSVGGVLLFNQDEEIKYSSGKPRSILQRSSTAKHVLREELLALATPCVDALSSPHERARATGRQLPSRAVIKINDPIDLNFLLVTDNDQKVDINVKGKVVREDKDGVGIKFKKIDKDIQEIIMEYAS